MNLYRINTIIITGTLITLLSWTMPDKQKIGSKNWLNVTYEKCLEKKLPCDCEKITETYFTITLDINEKSKSFGGLFLRYDENEFDYLNIKKKSKDIYEVYSENNGLKYITGSLILKGDSLYYFDKDNKKSTFVNYDDSKLNAEYYYQKENVSLIDKALIKRGYPTLENILNQDSLNCGCNKELGDVNLISIDKRAIAWVIEQSADSIFIYNYANSSEGKTVPPKIIKKLLKSYRW